jgi:IclR family pca regulon transcriptional regulator
MSFTAALTPRDYIAGLAKGLQLLQAFDHAHQRLNATQAAQRAELTRAAARRYLLTLHALGYLETDGRQFWLTPKVMQFSGNYLASAQLPRVVQPHLDQLATHTGGAFSVVVPDGGEVVIVARSRTALVGAVQALPVAVSPSSADLHTRQAQHIRQIMTMAQGLHLGARLPMHATSTGQILMAYWPEAAVDNWLRAHPLTRLTPQTITTPSALLERLSQARAQHWVHAVDEHEWGVQAIAVPLQRADGQVVAALNVVLASGANGASPEPAITTRWLSWLHETAAQMRIVL